MGCPGTFPILFLAPFALILAGCGELNVVISADRSYRVGALIGSENLEEHALVREGDMLRPVFLSRITNDPDVVGLSVSLTNEGGAALTDDIVYKLRSARTAVDGVGVRWVSRLDEPLPAFTLPEPLPVGFYTLKFRVLGPRGGLSESRVPFFYLKNRVFFVGNIRSYPPGEVPAATAPLFPPEVYLLLEVPVEADGEIDPYIRWIYRGKEIATGRRSEGAHFLLWQTPGQEAFHEVHAEVSPDRPPANGADRPGITRRFPVAVSRVAPIPGGAGRVESYERLYRFLGTLSDELSPMGDLRGSGNPRWLPGRDTYGLAVGPKTVYTLDQPLVTINQSGMGRGEIFLRFALLNPGQVLRADFHGKEPEETFSLLLHAEKERLRIHLGTSGVENSMDIPLQDYPVLSFLELGMSIVINTGEISVSAHTGDREYSVSLPVALGLPYSGDGSVVFGGAAYGSTESRTEETSGYTLILDEFRQMIGEGEL